MLWARAGHNVGGKKSLNNQLVLPPLWQKLAEPKFMINYWPYVLAYLIHSEICIGFSTVFYLIKIMYSKKVIYNVMFKSQFVLLFYHIQVNKCLKSKFLCSYMETLYCSSMSGVWYCVSESNNTMESILHCSGLLSKCQVKVLAQWLILEFSWFLFIQTVF